MKNKWGCDYCDREFPLEEMTRKETVNMCPCCLIVGETYEKASELAKEKGYSVRINVEIENDIVAKINGIG